jgi:hypothetical protein
MRYAKFFFTLFAGLLFSYVSFAQTATDVFLPQYMQGVGALSTTQERRVPFVCRLTVGGLAANKTYRYYNKFINDPANTSLAGEGGFIIVTQSGAFIRTTAPGFTIAGRFGTFTTDASGSYTGWFAAEPNTATMFAPGNQVYVRLTLNDGNDGTVIDKFVTCNTPITTVNFGATAADGTALRSTAAAQGVAKNFVMLYDNTAGTGRPITGTFVEADGTANTTAAFYAPFYANDVNEKDKNWGTIIPNNLAGGVRRIVQYALSDASQVGFKTSADGTWAQSGGGTLATANATGGLTTVLVLDGGVIDLGPPVQQAQTITFNALTAKIYGEADFDPGATASSNLTVTYSSNNHAVATIVNGKVHIVGAGTVDITADQAGNVDYQAAPSVPQTLTVNKASLTITANNAAKVQGDPVPTNFAVTYTGFVNGENESVFTAPLTVTTTATQISIPGTYPITPGGAAAANYNISFVDGVLTVTASKQAQTITFGTLPVKTYGDANFATGATISSNLTIQYNSSDPAVATVVNGFIQINGVGTTTITAAHPGDANYEAAIDVPQVLTVNKAPLTIKANNQTRLVGQPNPALTITYTGFVKNETSTVFTTQPVISTTATTASPVGDYPINVSGAVAANYNITYVAGTLTVTPLPAQTITFDALPVRNYGDADVRPGATASSTLKVRYVSSNTNVATIVNDTMIHIVGAGTTDITASQPGDASNAPAPNVIRTFTVQKVNLVIRAKDTIKLEGQANPVFELLYTGFVNGDNVSRLTTPPVITTTATTGSLAGRYTLNVSGATSNNYNIAQVAGTFSILPAQGASQDNLSTYVSSPGQLRVNIHAVESGKASIQLFDQYGTRLLQLNVTLAQGNNTYHLPIGNITAGVYHIRVNGAGFTLKSKVSIR